MENRALDRRVWIKGLAVECPLGKALSDCPLNDTRTLATAQMNHIINNQSDRKVHALYKHHQHCIRIRATVLSIQQANGSN